MLLQTDDAMDFIGLSFVFAVVVRFTSAWFDGEQMNVIRSDGQQMVGLAEIRRELSVFDRILGGTVHRT